MAHEAKTVRGIFERYLELGSVRLLKDDLDRRGVRSKIRTYQDGAHAGGHPFSRGALYALLSNPVYIGEIRHKDVRHPGLHEPILDRKLWDAVQQRLSYQGSIHRARTGKVVPSPLVGKLFDEAGNRLTPSHALKDGRRYRYYISQKLVTGTAQEQGWRLPADREDCRRRGQISSFRPWSTRGGAREGWPSPRSAARCIRCRQRLHAPLVLGSRAC